MKRSEGGGARAALRVLLPTWRFFDEIGFGLQLSARFGRDADALGPWLLLLPLPPAVRARRRVWHLLLDPHGNLQLAHRALLDRLVGDLAERSEPDDEDDPRELVSYAQVLALVRAQAQGAGVVPDDARLLQFRLTQPAEDGAHEALLCSAVHPLQGA